VTARFWIYWNGGVVKVTLAPGESFELSESHPTDEGYSATYERYEHAGDCVVREISHSGRDCDGGHGEHREEEARMDALSDVFNEYVGISYPAWQTLRPTRCYDQFAQMAGY